MISVKLHLNRGEVMLAACDADIIGLSFSGNGAKITVSERFYGGETVSEEVFVERTKSAAVMNLVGNRVVARAIAEGIVNADCVIEIGGVKHAQVVML